MQLDIPEQRQKLLITVSAGRTGRAQKTCRTVTVENLGLTTDSTFITSRPYSREVLERKNGDREILSQEETSRHGLLMTG